MRTEATFNIEYLERKLAYEEGMAAGEQKVAEKIMAEAENNDWWIPEWIIKILNRGDMNERGTETIH